MTNTLISKIAAASTKVGALKPDKTNTAQNYSYISADKILERAGDALADAGIVILPSFVNESVTEVSYTDSYGKTKTRYDALVKFEMLISDGESELNAFWSGRGSDFSVPDKAMYKAITSGHKYFIAKLLNVGVGNEDGEHENVPAQQAQDATKSAPAQAKPLATADQVKQLDKLGLGFYGKDEWKEQAPKLAQAVSKGNADTPEELLQVEIAKLIAGIEKKIWEIEQSKKVAAA